MAGSPRAGEKQMEQWALARLDQTSQLSLVRICPDTVLSLVDTECNGWNPYDTEKATNATGSGHFPLLSSTVSEGMRAEKADLKQIS